MQSNNTKFQYAEDFDPILQGLANNFTIFKSVIIEGGITSPVSLKGNYRIKVEGIYNTYFFATKMLKKYADPIADEDDDFFSNFNFDNSR